DSYVVLASAASPETTDTTSNGTSKKKGMTVTVTADDMKKRKNEVKARTTLLLSLPDEHQLRFTKHSKGNEDATTASVSTASTNVPTASTNIKVASIRKDTACAYIASQSSENHELVAEKEAPTEFALMANTSAKSKVFENSLCSKDCKKNTNSLNKSSPDDAQNRNPSVTKTEASPSTISPKYFIKFVKANDSPTTSKTDKAETTKKLPVKYAEQYKKPTKKPNVRGIKGIGTI
nr:hypothetical protein [Tanacetum cinerariifolium]